MHVLCVVVCVDVCMCVYLCVYVYVCVCVCIRDVARILTSDSSLKNSWAAYGPGNSNCLEIDVID